MTEQGLSIYRRAVENKEASIKRKKPFLPDADYRPPTNVPGIKTDWGLLDPEKAARKAKHLNGEITVTKLDLTEEQMAEARAKQEQIRDRLKQGTGHIALQRQIRAKNGFSYES